MLACLGWGILLIIAIVILCCFVPWWMVLLLVVVVFLSAFIPWNQPYIDRSKSKKYKSLQKKQKDNTTKKDKQNKESNIVNRTNTNTVLGGAALNHYSNNDIDYERLRAIKEEQAAYDDFIASLDMADDK